MEVQKKSLSLLPCISPFSVFSPREMVDKETHFLNYFFFYLMFWWQFGSPPNEHAAYGALVLSKMEGIP